MTSVFIAGARIIRKLDDQVKSRLMNIYKKNFRVIVGDANGVDKLIQQFFNDLKYRNVKIFASNGKARNNIGKWSIEKVVVEKNVNGFDFYAAKDKEMAKAADYGFMIWNGKSKGTLNNIINLLNQSKKTLIYLTTDRKFYCVNSQWDLEKMISKCENKTKNLFRTLLNIERPKNNKKTEQLLLKTKCDQG